MNFFCRELLGAITTFSSLAYIIVVSPTILSDGGLPFGSVMIATILVTAFATALMGALTNLPIAIAPGIGVAAYFIYSIILKDSLPWEKGFVALFLVGALLLILTIFKVRRKILSSLPQTIIKSLVCGIGLFLISVGLSQIGLIKASHNTLISFGDIHTHKLILTAIGLTTILVLIHYRQNYAFILVILGIWAFSLAFGYAPYKGLISTPPSISPTFFRLDFSALSEPVFYKYCFSLFLIALFDSTAGLIPLIKSCQKSKDIHPDLLQKALIPDSLTSMISPFLGASSMAVHIESLSGIKAGSRKGLTSYIVSICFVGCLFFYPLFSSIPEFAIAPVLMALGIYMFQDIKGLNYKSLTDLIPFVITVLVMPLTFSIYMGLAFGFISFTCLKLITGKQKEVPLSCWIFSILFLIVMILF